MKHNLLVLAIMGVTGIGVAAKYPTTSPLPPCSSKASTPCKCPAGTQYWEATTVGIIGANAHDVQALINDFYNISWQLGAVPYNTKGPNNKVGSIRSVRYPLVPSGIEDVDERLVARTVSPDGSFVMAFEQVQPSIPYPDGTGFFAGWWGSITGTAATGVETITTWTNWACETRNTRDFAGFHEITLNNATSILTAHGKVVGVNVNFTSAKNY